MTISSEAAINMVPGLVGASGHDMLDCSRQNVAVVWGICGTLIRGRGCGWSIWKKVHRKGARIRVAEHGGVGWNRVEAHDDEPPCLECAWEERAELNIKYVRIKYKLDEKINHVEMI